MKTIFSILNYVIVIISIIAAFFVFCAVKPDKLIKPDETPVSASRLEDLNKYLHTGKTAGADIKRLSGIEDFKELHIYDCVTAEPKNVVATGVYSRNPWVLATEQRTIRRKGRAMGTRTVRNPEATDSFFVAVTNYQEYYLIQLPDNSYILAQFSETYKERIEKGERVTLPIGSLKTTSGSAREYLKEICAKYNVDNTYTLYMIDDEWYEAHDTLFFFIKFGVAVVVFFVLGVILIIGADKLQKIFE